MALKLKTIEFAATTNVVTLATATKRTLAGSTQIFIPESTITFKSCMLEMFASTDSATAASLTAISLGINLGVVAESLVALSAPSANSGEAETWMFSRDVTEYFTTNWIGKSMTWTSSFTGTGVATNNHGAKLTITYQYEESTSNTQIKTIRIPIESTRTLLTSSWLTVGGAATIPPFKGTYLPEAGITVRQMFLDIQANNGMNAVTNFSGQTRIGGSAVLGNGLYNFNRNGTSTLNSATWIRSFIDFTPLNLTGSTNYTLEMITSLTSRYCLPGGIITCTYEYNSSGSTVIYNSLMIGGIDTPGQIGGTTIAQQSVWDRNIYIEEPNTINIKESGVGLFFIDSAGFNLRVAVTGETSGQTSLSTYTVTPGAVQCGQYSIFHRVDSGGQNTKGLYLKRGKNRYVIQIFSTTAQSGWNLSGFLLLNYTSGKYDLSPGSHAHTCFQYVSSGVTATRVQTSNTFVSSPIPETNYNLIGYVSYIAYAIGVGTDQAITLQAMVLDNEAYGDGWMSIYNGQGRTDNENSLNTSYGATRVSFKRWNGDTDPERLDIKSARRYRLDSCPLNYAYFGYYYTYNSIAYVISGTCSGYSGDGSGIQIDIYRVLSSTYDEHILSLVTTTGGIFSGVWIDNTDTLFASARQDDTHVGRSKDGLAG